MKNYFRLNPFVRIESSDKNACLYNLSTGEMLSLDKEKAGLILNCEKNNPIENAADRVFFDDLHSMNIGKYYDLPVFIDKMSLGYDANFDAARKKNFSFSRLFIEITNECNLDCVFCNYDDGNAYRTTGCKRWDSINKSLSIDDYKRVILQSSYLGLQEIIFMGGEPLLEIQKIEELMSYAISLGINRFAIYTNLLLLNDYSLDILVRFNVSLVIEIFSYKKEEYESISKKEYDRSIEDKIQTVSRSGLAHTIKILTCKLNEDSINQIISKTKELSPNGNIKLDIIYPHNEQFSSELYKSSLYNEQSKFVKVTLPQYISNLKSHNCLGHQIGITNDGFVLPCIMMRNNKLGSIIDKDLIEVLIEGKYDDYQSITKDKITKCKSCSFKYGCFDCRAIEIESTKDLYGAQYCELIV